MFKLQMRVYDKTFSFSSIWDQTGKSVKKVLSNHAYAIYYNTDKETDESLGPIMSNF